MSRAKKDHTCVVGLGWGDEGKGKIVDLLCADHDIVVRANGGANAGHTVCVGDRKFILHLLPSGVLNPNKLSVIGPGVVIDPSALVGEIDELAACGVHVGDNLRISDRAHVVMPYHKLEDRLDEAAAAEGDQIGTTARGIGPCYADKMRRSTALRMCDLLDSDRLKRRVPVLVAYKLKVLRAVHGDEVQLDADEVLNELRSAADRLRPFVCNTTPMLRNRTAAGDRILFEAANGMLLDVDHGTYPFVTSSGTTPTGVASGAGVPARSIVNVLGIVKAYATRVGRGPFPSELSDDTGDQIRRQGNEYGSTTGRPRRCGWFDAVATRHSVDLGGITEIAMMHLDTLRGFEQVGICTGYRCDGQSEDSISADAEVFARMEPVIELLPGWSEDLSRVDSIDGLPPAARRYLDRVESLVGAPITIVSVGPERSQTLIGDTRTMTPNVSIPTV